MWHRFAVRLVTPSSGECNLGEGQYLGIIRIGRIAHTFLNPCNFTLSTDRIELLRTKRPGKSVEYGRIPVMDNTTLRVYALTRDLSSNARASAEDPVEPHKSIRGVDGIFAERYNVSRAVGVF